MQIPDPTFMDLVPWTEAVNQVISSYQCVQEMQGTNWQAWGTCFFNSPSLAALDPPDPYEFSDWIKWGQQLALALQGGSGAEGAGASGSPTSSPTTAGVTDQNGFNLVTQQYETIVTQ